MPSPLLANMPFVHPTIAGIALLTGLIPVLIHLLNRRRFRRIPWAAMSFLLAANRRSAKRVRLEQLLLMLARIGVVVLLGLAVARPYVPASAILPGSSSRVHRIVLVDNSLSMNAHGADGRTRFAAAQQCATRLVDSFPPADAVSLVSLAAPAEAVIAHAAYDRRFVRESLAAILSTQRATDTVGALSAARDILKASDAAAGNRAVYLISDFPKDVWESDTPQNPTAAVRATRQLADALLDPSMDLNLIRVDAGSGENIAVTRLTPESPLIGVNVPVRIAVEVTNFGDSTVRNASLQVRRDWQTIRREQLPRVEPGSSVVSSVSTEFAAAGTHAIEARVTAATQNMLEDDDVRYLSLEVRESAPVLLVDGRPGVKLLDGQAGFLATALAPNKTASAKDYLAPRLTGRGADLRRPAAAMEGRSATINLVSPKVITESELEGEALPAYDVVALCNVGRLSAKQWAQLERFTSAGGGLLIFLGDLVSADHYNRYGYADGHGLMPGKIGRPIDLTSMAAEAAELKLDRQVHPIVAEFAAHPTSGLFLARVEHYVPIEPEPNRAEVVLRYGNDAPALLASTFGKGRVLIWTTTANMDWTNLPAKGDYVAVMLNAVSYLVRPHGEHRNVLIGQSIVEPLTPAESSTPLSITALERWGEPSTNTVTTGEGAAFEPSVVAHEESDDATKAGASGLALSYGPVERAQFLTLSIGSASRVVAANIDPAESNLKSVDDRKLTAALDRPVRIVSDTAAADEQPIAARSTELASVALYMVMILLLGEIWMAMWFGSPRQAAAGDEKI
jgi:uncharacterized membrane protein